MKITADKLKAIERSIGHNARATVVCEDHGWKWDARTHLEVTAMVDGEVMATQVRVAHNDIPFGYIAKEAVLKMNDYIMNKQFDKAFTAEDFRR